MADRPLDGATPRYPNFATDDVVDPVSLEANVQTPSVEVQASGWRRLERPPRYWLNWLHRLYNQWIQWFDQEVESFRTIINVTIPNQISGLDGRIDTLESEMDTAQSDITGLDGRLDTLETTVNTTVDGRLDDLETFEANVGIQYSLIHQIGLATMDFTGLGSGGTSVAGYYVLYHAYNITGTPQKVELILPGVNGTANAGVLVFETAVGTLPAAIRPASTVRKPITVLDNSVLKQAMLVLYADGKVEVWPVDTNGTFTSNNFASTGTKGFATDLFISYLV